MHVFLTGPVQIGKSTLLRASLDALQPQKLGGFRTVSAQPQADGSRPVYLHPACSPDELHESANRVGIRRPGLGIVSFPAAFETAGLAALAGAEDCDLLLMDEIGRMERRAEGYSARILTLLDGGVPILGVVQKKADTPLAQAIRSHPRVRLIEVSEENRETCGAEHPGYTTRAAGKSQRLGFFKKILHRSPGASGESRWRSIQGVPAAYAHTNQQ